MGRLTPRIIPDAVGAVQDRQIGPRTRAGGTTEEFGLCSDRPVILLGTVVSHALGEEISAATDPAVLHAHVGRLGLELDPCLGGGPVLEARGVQEIAAVLGVDRRAVRGRALRTHPGAPRPRA